jgi:tetratricopeptide (TPR) repeat protein
MLTIVLSLVAGLLLGGGLRAGGVVHSIPAAVLPGLLVSLGVLVFLFRRVSARINPLMEEVQRHLQGNRQDMALGSLRGALRWSRWHPLLEPQLHTQIGALLYAQQDYDAALTELRQGAKSPWESRAFLACCYFKKREEADMVRAFEDAKKAGEKDDLYWTLYAWCLNAQGKKDEAQKALKAGLDKLPGNQRLQGSLEALAEGKKIKVAPFGDRWARFGLDGSVATGGLKIPKAMRGFAQRPGFRQRPAGKRR